MKSSIIRGFAKFVVSLTTMAVTGVLIFNGNLAFAETSLKSDKPSSRAESTIILSSLSLSMADLSVNSQEIYNEPVTLDGTNHLLTASFIEALTLADLASPPASYTDGHIFSAVSFDEGVILGNFTYSFSSTEAAIDVANKSTNFLLNNGGTSLPEYASKNGKVFESALKILDEEGTNVYWYITTCDNFLVALFVDGISDSETQHFFELSIATVIEKQLASYNSRVSFPVISGGKVVNEVQSSEVQWRGPAWRVAWAFNDSWRIPHYGAWFIGRNGRSQYFICAFPPSDYGSWNWWGNNRSVLLLNKRHLAVNPSMWKPGCHYAVLDYP